ncbi:hypothetical protein GLAREA_12996 [Glarea lozoyensis ATCC 20868]|uniref:Uncharacterized protein n=1 Tax=Glarea lozoyensis (strain ATCC 20868 / MF5171) TaxID=1116229 RepID=S3DV70_GLAL2|nr:uncharacterized protein GLAREA_12996 [Glarea lozoyensis ATCC 20868]EPE30273.1 hypothetical protein GLAREA_12996 [Glarea lozoyensis ATCC 20868]
MAAQQKQIALVRDAGTKDVAVVISTLAEYGIPSAMYGVNAATHHNGGLCPLDIELVVNEEDQSRAFDLLTAQGALPMVPVNSITERPTDFNQWRQLAKSYQYFDRCRTRLSTPIYQLPPTEDALDDMLLPFVVLYSAESVGLPPVPSVKSDKQTLPSKTMASTNAYVSLSTLSSLDTAQGTTQRNGSCLIPTFSKLVKSEMHILLSHAEFHSPVWGQHMAQLSELINSRDPGDLSLDLSPRYADFLEWVLLSMKGDADYAELDGLKESYRQEQLP